MYNFLLDILAVGSIFSGIMVITAKNPVISVLFLIAVFINIAGYLILLGAPYLGLVYLIVYVGAIAILFLFVIMMLNLRLVELVDTGQEYTKNLPMGALLSSLFLFEILSIVPGKLDSFDVPLVLFNNLNSYLLNLNPESGIEMYNYFNPIITHSATAFTQIETIGHSLYTWTSLWLIMASIIFLLAMLGPIVLCMNLNIKGQK